MKDLSALENQLDIKFRDVRLLNQALVHRSYLNENREVKESNERLEFLGDSVLSLLTAEELYGRFTRYAEGELTNLRSGLVRTQTLASIARSLLLGQHILMSKGEERSGGRENTSLLADTFEAVLGAIYLDQGLTAARKFLRENLFPIVADINKHKDQLDFKSKLQEITQRKQKLSPTYKVISTVGPDHDKTFLIGVSVGEHFLGEGSGKSKQEAEQEAARIAIVKLKS